MSGTSAAIDPARSEIGATVEKNTDGVVKLEDRGLKYRLRILINHPTENLDLITRETGITPKTLSTKGQQRIAPNGSVLPGTYQFSTWGYSRDIRDSRRFGEGIQALLDALAPARDSIHRLRADGGRAMLILELQGERNIGDVLASRDLTRFAEIGLDLGIEMYPEGF